MIQPFIKARPVWAQNLELEKNKSCIFKTTIPKGEGQTLLRIAACTNYRVLLNGEFIGFGPARAAHGFYRVDELDISSHLNELMNTLEIEVVGYNVNSYYTLDQPSFLQAEVVSNGEVVAATALIAPTDLTTPTAPAAPTVATAPTAPTEGGFLAFLNKDKIQKVQRYSFQRPFVECYRFNSEHEAVALSEVSGKVLIKRNIPNYKFNRYAAKNIFDSGVIIGRIEPKRYFSEDRSVKNIGDELKGFIEDELEIHLTDEVEELEMVQTGAENCPIVYPIAFQENTYSTIDFGVNKTGFIGADFNCSNNCTVYFLFDEVLKDGHISFLRSECANAMKLEFQAGENGFQSFEPYTLKYLRVIVAKGTCQIKDLFITEFKSPLEIKAKYQSESESESGNENESESENQKLKEIYAAAVETFEQNCVDIYMDCPSRERAGWLCDSFFTSRVEYALTGGSVIEKNFLENYLLPDTFKHLPEGMLPMAYPTDNNDGGFIPNWALWFVIQLEEYLSRSNDLELVKALKERVYKLFQYFEGFKNERGLLEKLEGWIFIEWSKCNELGQDINFPSNMLYASALQAAGRLFGDAGLIAQGERLKGVIRELSFDGEFFVDNAYRTNGEIVLSGERTETCFVCCVLVAQTLKQT